MGSDEDWEVDGEFDDGVSVEFEEEFDLECEERAESVRMFGVDPDEEWEFDEEEDLEGTKSIE